MNSDNKNSSTSLSDADVVKVLETCPFATSQDMPLRSIAQALEAYEWDLAIIFDDVG